VILTLLDLFVTLEDSHILFFCIYSNGHAYVRSAYSVMFRYRLIKPVSQKNRTLYSCPQLC